MPLRQPSPGRRANRGRARPDRRGGATWRPAAAGPGTPWSGTGPGRRCGPASSPGWLRCPGSPVAAVGAATPAGAAAAPVPLTLISQTPSVATGGLFDVRFRVGATAPAAAQLGVAVSVYACLSSVSAFDQSVNSATGPEGTPIDSTAAPLALAGLPAAADGALDLAMPVAVGGGGTPPAGGFAINLVSRGGQCGAYPAGVYPVRIQLVDTANGQAVGAITTHLVYTDDPGRHPAAPGGGGAPARHHPRTGTGAGDRRARRPSVLRPGRRRPRRPWRR